MRTTSLLSVLLLTVGCASEQETQCRVGADCASGVCNYDGTCAPIHVPNQETGLEAEPQESSSPEGGEETQPEAAAESDAPSTTCSPNHDGVITREEVPLRAGLHATFKIATNVPVDTKGTESGGTTTWDFAGDLAGDHLSLIELQDLTGAWFASKFPGASYASRLSDTETLLGVFEITDTQLLLRGVVSPEEGPTRTELTYDPPVVTLSFPLQAGSTWTTTAQVTGLALGVLSTYTEKYESQVDAAGDLKVPYGTFPVQRVRVVLTRTVGVVPTITRSFLFVTECFGTVATINSKSNETKTEFTTAAEIKRLSP